MMWLSRRVAELAARRCRRLPVRRRRRRCRRPRSPAPRVLPRVTSAPARFCSSRATCSSDVPHPGSLAHALQEPTRFADRAAVLVETGEQLGEVLVEAGNLVGRPLLQLADIDFHQDGRHAGPDVGSTEDGGVADLDRHGINSGGHNQRLIGTVEQVASLLCGVKGSAGGPLLLPWLRQASMSIAGTPLRRGSRRPTHRCPGQR